MTTMPSPVERVLSQRIDLGGEPSSPALDRLIERRRDETVDVATRVRQIIEAVRQRGDDALVELTRELDQFDSPAAGLRVTTAEIDDALADCPAASLDALRLAAERIEFFHRRQRPVDDEIVDSLGVRAGIRWQAIASVGLYVPGGTAAYPSSVLMNAVPAKVAGCERLVMVAPTPRGRANPMVLAAASIAGVDEIYRIGGAQAIAALAYGTATIAPVDKVVGPGNAYVAEAKRQLFGRIGIDMLAGPSEIVVVADNSANPAWIAADLLSQAEHDEVAQAILVTDNREIADAATAEVERQLADLPRAAIARRSWQREGAVIVAQSQHIVSIVDRLAPEHLELMVADPDALAGRIRRAGAIFLGHFTPEVIGDYVGGPNHVLPTSRSARFSSGLAVWDFMTRTSYLGCDERAFRVLGPAAMRLAADEGLQAHARAAGCRLGHHA